jgi:hypothetical protein
MCTIMSWDAHEYVMHPIFVLKNGCDSYNPVELDLEHFSTLPKV